MKISKRSGIEDKPSSNVPNPLKKNYDYGEIPNWIDRVKWFMKRRKNRKANIDNLKF